MANEVFEPLAKAEVVKAVERRAPTRVPMVISKWWGEGLSEQYGDRLAFIGGLDARVLESGDRDLIRREVTRLIEGMKARGARYVFASDHSLSTNVRYDDYRYALDVYREHREY